MKWIDDLVPAEDPDLLAIIDHDNRHFTYGDLAEMVDQMARALAAHGLRPGDRLICIAENSATFAVSILAAARLRAWITPLNARQSENEIEAVRNHSGARAILFTPEASPPAMAHANRLGASVIGRLACGDILVTPVYETEAEPLDPTPETQVAALMYTTGTTSAPKGVMLTHSNLMWNARASGGVRELTPGDVVLAVLPATHIYCFSSGILAALHARAAIRFIPRFTPEAVLDAFAEGASMMPAVPQMYQAIVNHLKSQGKKPYAPRLRLISSGGAPLDPDWKRGIEEFFGLPLHNGYGLTETSPGVSVTRSARPRPDTSVGEPVEGVELLIDAPNEDGVGELLIRGPNIMKGYYRNPEATSIAIRPDGFFCSGDLARFGENGDLYIAGRKKELIIRSGFNVYPPEIEAMLTRHPDVHQAAVVGRQIPGNEEILAFILTEPGASAEAIETWLRDQLVAYKIPQHFLIVDAYPAAPTGKILKHKLIETFKDRLPPV